MVGKISRFSSEKRRRQIILLLFIVPTLHIIHIYNIFWFFLYYTHKMAWKKHKYSHGKKKYFLRILIYFSVSTYMLRNSRHTYVCTMYEKSALDLKRFASFTCTFKRAGIPILFFYIYHGISQSGDPGKRCKSLC